MGFSHHNISPFTYEISLIVEYLTVDCKIEGSDPTARTLVPKPQGRILGHPRPNSFKENAVLGGGGALFRAGVSVRGGGLGIYLDFCTVWTLCGYWGLNRALIHGGRKRPR